MSVENMFISLPDEFVLLDGGMGQELINRNASGQGVLWSAKALFDAPEAVQAVHEDYILAGADVITTNSYACIRNNFEPQGVAHRLGEMNRLAAELAQRARDNCGKPGMIAKSTKSPAARPMARGCAKTCCPISRPRWAPFSLRPPSARSARR